MSSLRCRLVDSQGRERAGEVRGVIADSSEARLTVDFGRGEDVVLPLGVVVSMDLFGPDLYLPHTLQGRPTLRAIHAGAQRYTFRIDPSRRLELEMVVGGRASLRVGPKTGHPVEVELVLPTRGDSIVCQLRDASVSSLSVEIGWADEKRLAGVRDLDVLVRLPGARGGTPIHACVRRRAVNGDHIVYGLALDESLTPVGHEGLKALVQWVEARYQELSGGVRVLRRTA